MFAFKKERDGYWKWMAGNLASGGAAGATSLLFVYSLYFGMYDSIKPVLLVGPLEGNFLASFMLGWGVTTGAGIASYPLDTIRRRMMMTSGEAVKYKSSLDAASKIMAAEGVRSFFKGAGANILRVLPVLVFCPSMTRFNFSCSARPSRAVPAKRLALRLRRQQTQGTTQQVSN